MFIADARIVFCDLCRINKFSGHFGGYN